MAGRPDFSITMGLVGASTIVTGIQSTIAIMALLIRKVSELAEAADAYGDVVSGHRVSVQQADEATAHLVDSIELHRQAARLEAAGMEVTAEQYRAIVVAATRFAQTTGGDVTQSVEGLTSAVISGNARGLRPYGVTLQATGTVAQRQRIVVDQLTQAFRDQTVAVEGTQDRIEQLQNNWSTAWHEMLLALEREAGPIRVILDGLNSLLEDVNNALQTQRTAREHMERMGTTTQQLQLQNDLNNAGYTVEGNYQQGAFATMRRFGIAAFQGIGSGEMDRNALASAAELRRLQQQDITRIQAGTDPVVRDAPKPLYTSPDDPGGGGRRSSREVRNYQDTQAHMIEAMDAVYEAQQELAQQNLDKRTAIDEAMKASIDSLAEREIEANARRLENMEAFNERAVELWQKEADERERSLDNLKTYAGVAYQIYGQMLTAVGGLAGALAENAEKQKKIEGGIRVAQQVGALLYATTMAAIEFAGNNYVQGAAYTAAALVAAVDLAKTVAEFGVQSKSGTSGSSTAGSQQAGGSSGGMYQGRQSSVSVYFMGPVTSRRARDEVIALERDGARAY